MPFLRRVAFAPVVLLVVAAVTYGMPRVLRPDLYPGERVLPGLMDDLSRAFLHLDFGCAGILAAARRSTTSGCAGWRGTCGCSATGY